MVRIKYFRRNHEVTIEGHAKSGEFGRDLVCASVSMLAHTLAAFVVNTGFENSVAELKEGRGVIRCCPDKKSEAAVALVMDSICAGFDWLYESYPEYIKYEIVNYTRDRKQEKTKGIV